MSWHTRMRRSFWLSFNSHVIIFVQTFCMSKSSKPCFFHIQLMIIQRVNWRSPHTTCFTCPTFILVLLIEGLPHLKSSFTSSNHSFDFICHSKILLHNIIIIIINSQRSHRGVMANVLVYNSVVSSTASCGFTFTFKLKSSRQYEPSYTPTYAFNSTTTVLLQRWLCH